MPNHGLAADALGPFPDESHLSRWSAGISPDRVIVVGEKNFGENNGHVYARRYRPDYYEQRVALEGGDALNTANEDEWREIMMYATRYRESYPYYQHEKIGYNYRMSNICAGIGRGQMTVVEQHLAHHKHVQKLYEELLADVPGVHVHSQPAGVDYDSNYWLCTITIDPDVKIKGQENAYKTIVKGAVGGAAGVIHMASSATTDCQPNDNVEALRVLMDQAQIEARPVWKPMHKQPCYKDVPAYVNGVSEALFKVGMCLPAGPYVSDEDVRYIVETIKNAIVK